MGKKSQDPTVSTYYVGLHFVPVHGPVDSLNRIRVDKKTAWVGTTTGGTITINAPELFGGKDREGGIVGDMDVEMGLLTQTPNAYLQAKQGVSLPAWRNLVSCIFKGGLVGNNYYLKPWQFEFTRIHKLHNGSAQWQDSLASPIATLINAVHVVRECLTNPVWGYGYSELEIDETSFLAAAQTCYNERLAFGFLWEGNTSLDAFIKDVLKHIQGNLYRSRTDDKWHITLIRQITDTSALITLNTSNTKSVNDFRRKMTGDLVSTVTVKFLDNSTYEKNTVTITDISLTQRQSNPITQTLDYSGVTCPEVAQRIAIRESRAMGLPLYSANIVCNLVAADLHVGDAFKLVWPDHLPDTLVMRVVTIDLGTANKQEITIGCIQDSFQAADLVYTIPVDSAWVDPINVPTAVSFEIIQEAPYYLIAKEHGDSFAQGVASLNTFIMLAAVAPTPDSYTAGVWSKTTGTYAQYGYLDFCFSATLSSGVDKLATSLSITNIAALEHLTVNSFIQIDNEYLQVTVIGASTLTVIRGVLDTVPESHSTSARLFGVQDFHESDNITYLTGETVYSKLTPLTPKGELAIGSATEMSKVMVGRMHFPYPPANVTVNSAYWPSVSMSPITVAWATRNRLQQTAGLNGFYTGSITTEAGVTYSGSLKRTDTMAVLDSFTGETGTSHVLTTAYTGNVILDLWAVRDGLESYQHVTHTFILGNWDTLPSTWNTWTSWI